jgi:hypothetical protein
MTVETVPASAQAAAGQRALGLLRASPALAPALVGVVLLVVLGASEGGIEPTDWRPVALAFLALVAISVIALPRPAPPRTVVVALALLAAYVAWSFLSITWADSQGPALEGAGRTLMYALVFALFALWPLRGSAPALIAGALGLGIAAVGLVELLRLGAAADPNSFLFRGRLSEPVGYANANVAFWMAGLLPCLVLAARREVPPLLRGIFLGGASVLAGMALMGQSRGWLLAVPVIALLALAVVPGRARLIVATVALGLGVLVILDPALGVYDASGPNVDLAGPVDDAVRAIVFTSVALTFLGALAAFLDSGVRVSEGTARRAGKAIVVATVAMLAIGALAVAARENPIDRVQDAWQELQEGERASSERGGPRFTRDLATNRYDFWRVSWENFERAPIAGVGVDNFQQDYLEHGDSSEAPRYPHSVELSVLSETGVIGALLLFGAIGAALVAAAPALRRAHGVGGAGAAAGVLVLAYWVAHGSVDWLWEFPALGGSAFAMLGLAVAAAPRAVVEERQGWIAGEKPAGTPVRRTIVWFAGGAAALLALVALALPWLSERQIDRALEGRHALSERLDGLDRAAALNPFSTRPHLAAGSIAVIEGRSDIAAAHFEEALDHDPRSAYAALMAGAIASERGQPAKARALLALARKGNPNSEIVARAARRVRRGGTLEAAAITEQLATATRRRTAPETED